MNTPATAGLLFCILASSAVYAHGGVYRGPVHLPEPRRASGPTAPSLSASKPVKPPRIPSTGDGLASWQYWWGFTRDDVTILQNKEGPVGDKQLRRILSALKPMCAPTKQRDMTSSALIAVAKVGKRLPDVEILTVLRACLESQNTEIRRSAALAMGISGRSEALSNLLDLVNDTEAGRKLCNRKLIDSTTRAFAAYAIGLVLEANPDQKLKSRILDVLADQIAGGDSWPRDFHLALVHSIGLIARGDESLSAKAIEVLSHYFEQLGEDGDPVIRAQLLPLMASLFVSSTDTAKRDEFKRSLLAALSGKSLVAQAAAFALPGLVAPRAPIVSEVDQQLLAALWGRVQSCGDSQMACVSLMALGKIGGVANRDSLLAALEENPAPNLRAWIVLALAAYCHRNPSSVSTIALVLEDRFVKDESLEVRAAIALALGLMRHKAVSRRLHLTLHTHAANDEFAGYLCMALALMDERQAVGQVRSIYRDSSRRPRRLYQAGLALGILGDAAAYPSLLKTLREGRPNLQAMGVSAWALGQVAGGQSIASLLGMISDTSLTDLSRAFAVVALGCAVERGDRPWNHAIAKFIYYRSCVGSQFDQMAGLLDIY